jgi:Tol biopolymer transport system component
VACGPRISPDGQLLAFLTMVDGLLQVAVMKPDSGSWTLLTRQRGIGSVYEVSWAPDGSKLYFDRSWDQPRGVCSVPPLGGEPRLILENACGRKLCPMAA